MKCERDGKNTKRSEWRDKGASEPERLRAKKHNSGSGQEGLPYTQEKERAKREFFNARMENCLAIDIAVEYEGLINVFIPK